ncbi:Mob1p CYBJADRAFT_166042 [Cyberlindnera jadinii NRRL Y-1542]|uniref:Uncharacterized protein n=1 Tax=Cyberlindnera jadinii (strain ATCC 18201 / CBS 1600 / BCRC 20928 / JCM 3617 / NBRC 0987 / NRRL Y-1542) TaxID=983966 RepID=A0A1E4S6Y9_CYBJN|nr:hypothetical protein CYBJADRAFT_166042 [Cyberlindnera jadinii NRRL Y-1542]ODV75287.1 hypothetical protein CYBJADRAFT_166042 [Cyberlindnera jadinii NRRL Y-1542]
MSFFQSLHLNNGHTIKSTRGFKKSAHSSDANDVGRLGGRQVDQYSEQTSTGSWANVDHNYNAISTHEDIKHIVESTLGSGTALAQAVKLPRDENLNEWLAVHVVDFYNQINMLYGTITEFCSPSTCPRMIATTEYEYLWQDSNLSKPISVSAPRYVDCLMTWIQSLFDDDNIFPSKTNQPFPPQFQALVKTLMKRLFRIYAHIYCHHFNEIIDLGLNTLLNTSFKHFLLFADEFNLIAEKDYGPLQMLVIEMLMPDSAEDKHAP